MDYYGGIVTPEDIERYAMCNLIQKPSKDIERYANKCGASTRSIQITFGYQSGLLHAIAEVIEGIFEFGSWKPVLDQVTERDTLVYF